MTARMTVAHGSLSTPLSTILWHQALRRERASRCARWCSSRPAPDCTFVMIPLRPAELLGAKRRKFPSIKPLSEHALPTRRRREHGRQGAKPRRCDRAPTARRHQALPLRRAARLRARSNCRRKISCRRIRDRLQPAEDEDLGDVGLQGLLELVGGFLLALGFFTR